ncbi:uncharacterized protein F5891DRAFT_1027143 [Suillus fuscotomentosus]|uniref:Secreted protein n=1 Tax=Suillus fuscotomentosus TaxID=1912939 RepID=A0AAD4HMG7_9AGAM|nr:uncharacterized protein F5891DRAFT_1027143 [Suillus fuscotomentosus]KAG1902038.1 hypothetical protein F5891DRAFT_1027143 [Suillus fuscotomentosus]
MGPASFVSDARMQTLFLLIHFFLCVSSASHLKTVSCPCNHSEIGYARTHSHLLSYHYSISPPPTVYSVHLIRDSL